MSVTNLRQRYYCPKCDAAWTWDMRTDQPAITCANCGFDRTVQPASSQEPAPEGQKGLGTCSACGQHDTAPGYVCPQCGRPYLDHEHLADKLFAAHPTPEPRKEPDRPRELLDLAAQCLQVSDPEIRADLSWEADRAEFMLRYADLSMPIELQAAPTEPEDAQGEAVKHALEQFRWLIHEVGSAPGLSCTYETLTAAYAVIDEALSGLAAERERHEPIILVEAARRMLEECLTPKQREKYHAFHDLTVIAINNLEARVEAAERRVRELEAEKDAAINAFNEKVLALAASREEARGLREALDDALKLVRWFIAHLGSAFTKVSDKSTHEHFDKLFLEYNRREELIKARAALDPKDKPLT